MSSTVRAGAATLRIRPRALAAEAARCGLLGDTAIASHIGVAANTVLRIRTARVAPSASFIAQTLLAFPELKFSDLFEVVPVERVA